MNDNWEVDELKASVVAYIDMRNKEVSGEPFVKKTYYTMLAEKFGRSTKAYEYRMQNISYVYSLMGRPWVSGLKPASHTGANIVGKIESIINEIEGQNIAYDSEFNSTVDNLRSKKSQKPPNGNKLPKKREVVSTEFLRDPEIVAWVLDIAKGVCEACDKEAPFLKSDGKPFLEVHHLKRLADGGSDTLSNAIAVCPNCHRELHYGQGYKALIQSIYQKNERLIVE